ncbi:hypothetical protein M0R45_017322 [Rubus argutus]|uniref:Uncharacterized protein n=1 Tax=Rubus argutus TaxID=59490 RepID=A0AAW1XX73_RUBAR
MFVVTDNLIVSSVSPYLGLSVLDKMNVPISDIEVQMVHVGKEEAFSILVASFVCDSALISVFLHELRQKKMKIMMLDYSVAFSDRNLEL